MLNARERMSLKIKLDKLARERIEGNAKFAPKQLDPLTMAAVIYHAETAVHLAVDYINDNFKVQPK